MKLYTILLLQCLCLVSIGVQTNDNAEDYIRRSEAEWAESIASGDVSVAKRIVADDFIGVDTRGNCYDKPRAVSETLEASKVIASDHLDEVTIKVFGNTAIAQGSESWVRKDGDRGRFVWIDTWLFRDGRWQIVAAVDVKAPAK